DVLVLDPTRELGQDRVRERVPLDEHGPRPDALVGLDLDLGAVHDRVALALAAALVGHADLAVAIGRHQIAVAVHDGSEVVVLHDARTLGLVLGGLHHAARGAADVERPHGELRARLADRLRGDDADAPPARCAWPPMWTVRMVSCVPGSPIDCAAMMPTASPSSASRPVPRLRPWALTE